MSTSPDRKRAIIMWTVIGIVAGLAICGIGAFWYRSEQASKTYGVPLVVNAEGLDTNTGTKIPVHATGSDAQGNAVDRVFYGSSGSSDIALKPGDYSLAIEASPIAEDGTIYQTEGAATKVSIDKSGTTNVEGEITIEAIPAAEVTDDQIESACKAAEGSGIDQSKLDSLKQAAQKRRDDAVAAKEAEAKAAEEAQAKADAEAKAQAQAAQGGHSFQTDYFYVDVPSSWKSSEWSVRQTDDHTWQFMHTPANDYAAGATVSVAESDPWPGSNATEDLGPTGTGVNVFYTEAGADFFGEGAATIGLTQTYDVDDPDSIRADGISNSDYNAIANAREKLRQEQLSGKQ